MPRWSSCVGCELVKSAFSRLALVAAMVAIAPAGGIGQGRAKEARPCDGSQNEFNWGVKICQVDMDAPSTSRWPAKWRRPHYCAVAAELIFSNITKRQTFALRRQTFALTRQSQRDRDRICEKVPFERWDRRMRRAKRQFLQRGTNVGAKQQNPGKARYGRQLERRAYRAALAVQSSPA